MPSTQLLQHECQKKEMLPSWSQVRIGYKATSLYELSSFSSFLCQGKQYLFKITLLQNVIEQGTLVINETILHPALFS